MYAEIKSLTDKYFSNVFFWLFGLAITLYMLNISELSDGLLRYTIITLNFYTGLKLSFAVHKAFNFMGKHEKIVLNKDIVKDVLPSKVIKKWSIFNYFNRFLAEHPYTSFSIIGLIMLEQYTGYNSLFYSQVIENIPILKGIFPSLFIIIFLMIFSNYIDHINSKNIRRAIKIVIFIYTPIIIGYFFMGLLSPILLIIKGVLALTSMQDILLYFTSVKNLIWVFVYLATGLYILKCNFLEEQRIINTK